MHHFQLPSSFQTSAQVTITIDDVNDNAPVFEKASYQASVKEVSSMTNMKVSFRLSNWFPFSWAIGKRVHRSSGR